MHSEACTRGRDPLIYLLRHCRTVWDGQDRYVGQSDVPLSRSGREQADALKRWFSTIPIGRAVASDLARSHETALTITRGRPIQVETFRELREIGLGEWEGRTFKEVESVDPDQFNARNRNFIGHRPPGGENFIDLQNRVWPLFERLAAEKTEENILVIGHSWVNRVILCRLLGMPLGNLFCIGQDCGAINVILPHGRSCRVKTVNLTLEADFGARSLSRNVPPVLKDKGPGKKFPLT